MYLKNNYGDGYRLNLVTDPNNIDYARAGLREIIPTCKIVDESAGNFVVSVPLNSINELNNFFKIMEDLD